MRRIAALLAVVLVAATPLSADGGGHSSHRSSGGSSYRSHTDRSGSRSHHSNSSRKRDPAQRSAFQRTHPCPSTGKTSGACPGYVVDHVKPLKRGGADAPSNMQWQTKEAAKEKDRRE